MEPGGTASWGSKRAIHGARIMNADFPKAMLSSRSQDTAELICVLHIDPWPTNKPKIFSIGGTCENKWKQSRGWTEICGCYKMIFAVGHVRYWQSFNVCLESVSVCCYGNASKSLGALSQGSVPNSSSHRASTWVPSGREEEAVISGGLKVRKRCMIQRKKKVCVIIPVSLRLSLTYTTELCK